jgi:alpha-D-ribose 1-methylphosphonate 5-triphosphate synthase subunit PhnI
MYVAVKGGERAIDAAHAWLADERRGDTGIAALSVAQIREQLTLAVNRVMAEGSLYDPDLAALAIKQARGDLIEAVFLIRAYRTTLPRFGASIPVDTTKMAVARRVSATFKDLPGGQILGPTFDYTHRLLDFALMAEGEAPLAAPPTPSPSPQGGGEAILSAKRAPLAAQVPPSPLEGEVIFNRHQFQHINLHWPRGEMHLLPCPRQRIGAFALLLNGRIDGRGLHNLAPKLR